MKTEDYELDRGAGMLDTVLTFSEGPMTLTLHASDLFVQGFQQLAKYHHQLMRERGFWDHRDDVEEFAREEDKEAIRMLVDSQIHDLIHTEVAEATEALRQGNPPDDKCPSFSGVEAEMADVIIRILDYAGARGLHVAEAVVAKIEMNKSRDHKHGKKF